MSTHSAKPRAKYFTQWNDDWMTEPSHVCEVWVKDYIAWMSLNKVGRFIAIYSPTHKVRFGFPKIAAFSRK